jgi:oligopeptide transport system ATP-binding protein
MTSAATSAGLRGTTRAEGSVPVLEVRNLVTHYPVRGGLLQRVNGYVQAVNGISFTIEQGTTFGLVGESGSGKTTTAKQILRVEPPPPGAIFFEGEDISTFRGSKLKHYQRSVQTVFQDPFSSLNPRMRVRDILGELIDIHTDLSRQARSARVAELLALVGLSPGVSSLYPHQFSGGQRQRIAIARALALEPRLIVLDEPVSALDVSIRAQILNLLKDLQSRLNVAFLLIAHDLASVAYMSHRVAVMYLGKLVEMGPSQELALHPRHPYTQALFEATSLSATAESLAHALEGEIPSPLKPPSGCAFRTRCPFAMAACAEVGPELVVRDGAAHPVACHLYEPSAQSEKVA